MAMENRQMTSSCLFYRFRCIVKAVELVERLALCEGYRACIESARFRRRPDLGFFGAPEAERLHWNRPCNEDKADCPMI
uniref:Uncharacterized protein n=1 Tax=Hyaloperonospora arabidopsidis (strain Emoy2) TaxID=559515 RepID=M4BNN6_HYAAE